MVVEGNMPITDKLDPRYIQACIDQLPGLGDQKERRIIDVLKRDLLSTPESQETFKNLRQFIVQNWQDAFAHLDDPNYVHDITQEGARKAAQIAKCKLVGDSEEKLAQLKHGEPVMIVSNHLGTFKLVTMSPEELKDAGIEHQVPSIYYPYLTYFMPFSPIADKLGDNVYMASYEQPGKLALLFEAGGGIDVPPKEILEARTGGLVDSTRDLIDKHSNTALIVFPEGRTTGKISGGEIYDLQGFKKGAFAIASQLDMPVLPVGQFFDVKRGGFDIKVFDPFRVPSGEPKEFYQQPADSAKATIQAWLDTVKPVA